MFYAQIPNGWGVGDTPGAALRNARYAVGMTAAQVRRAPHYVLEFPEGTDIQTNTVWGSYSYDHSPTALAVAQNLDARQLKILTDMLEKAAA